MLPHDETGIDSTSYSQLVITVSLSPVAFLDVILQAKQYHRPVFVDLENMYTLNIVCELKHICFYLKNCIPE